MGQLAGGGTHFLGRFGESNRRSGESNTHARGLGPGGIRAPDAGMGGAIIAPILELRFSDVPPERQTLACTYARRSTPK